MHKEQCFTVDNFLSESECKSIIAYLEWLSDSKTLEWNQISFYDSFAMGFWPSDPNLERFGLPANYFNENLKKRIKDISENVLSTELSEVSYHAQKWTDGAYASFHSDNSDEDGNPTEFERSKFAVFIYLNDNFDGGELYYPGLDLEYRPVAGEMIIHPGTKEYSHGVRAVYNGVRITASSFITKKDMSDERFTFEG
jgi:Rps23 Pro-64 3,4-dihydroxylase Tpa1-like proline 4-hydroxylase